MLGLWCVYLWLANLHVTGGAVVYEHDVVVYCGKFSTDPAVSPEGASGVGSAGLNRFSGSIWWFPTMGAHDYHPKFRLGFSLK